MLSDLVKLAAERARDAAEEFFKLNNIDMAIKSLTAAKDFNPELPNIYDFFTAYKVHDLATKNSTWYQFLSINDVEVDSSVIKKQYKKMALMLHPDKNRSVAADGAFKIIQSAFHVLINPEKREAYDNSLHSKKRRPQQQSPKPSSHAASTSSKSSKPSPPTNKAAGSNQCRPEAAGDQESCSGRCQFQSMCVKTIHEANGRKRVVVYRDGKLIQLQTVCFGLDSYVRII